MNDTDKIIDDIMSIYDIIENIKDPQDAQTQFAKQSAEDVARWILDEIWNEAEVLGKTNTKEVSIFLNQTFGNRWGGKLGIAFDGWMGQVSSIHDVPEFASNILGFAEDLIKCAKEGKNWSASISDMRNVGSHSLGILGQVVPALLGFSGFVSFQFSVAHMALKLGFYWIESVYKTNFIGIAETYHQGYNAGDIDIKEMVKWLPDGTFEKNDKKKAVEKFYFYRVLYHITSADVTDMEYLLSGYEMNRTQIHQISSENALAYEIVLAACFGIMVRYDDEPTQEDYKAYRSVQDEKYKNTKRSNTKKILEKILKKLEKKIPVPTSPAPSPRGISKVNQRPFPFEFHWSNEQDPTETKTFNFSLSWFDEPSKLADGYLAFRDELKQKLWFWLWALPFVEDVMTEIDLESIPRKQGFHIYAEMIKDVETQPTKYWHFTLTYDSYGYKLHIGFSEKGQSSVGDRTADWRETPTVFSENGSNSCIEVPWLQHPEGSDSELFGFSTSFSLECHCNENVVNWAGIIENNEIFFEDRMGEQPKPLATGYRAFRDKLADELERWVWTLPFVTGIALEIDSGKQGFHICAAIKNTSSYWHFTLTYENTGYRLHIGLSNEETMMGWRGKPSVFSLNQSDFCIKNAWSWGSVIHGETNPPLKIDHLSAQFSLDCYYNDEIIYWRGVDGQGKVFFEDLASKIHHSIHDIIPRWTGLKKDGYDTPEYIAAEKQAYGGAEGMQANAICDENGKQIAMTPAIFATLSKSERQKAIETELSSMSAAERLEIKTIRGRKYTPQVIAGKRHAWYVPAPTE